MMHLIFARRYALLISTVMLSLACAEGPAAPTPVLPPPPPPVLLGSVAGAWTFTRTVTTGDGECALLVGRSSTERVTMVQAGAAAPYEVRANGFGNSMLYGYVSTGGNLRITGPVGGGKNTTISTFQLVREGSDLLTGTEATTWGNPVTCRANSTVVATRD
jgi:hypothetical protein